MPKLERKTRRLVVRPLNAKDYEVWKAYFETMGDAKNIWDRSSPKSGDLTKAKFQKALKDLKTLRDADKFYDFAVFERKSGKQVGRVSAMDVLRSVSQTAYLGYFIHNQFWSKGYGRESVEALIDIAFTDLKLHRLEAGVEPNNRRSIMLARSLGFRKEGLKKRMVFIRGEWQDLVVYSATCEDLGYKWRGTIGDPRVPRR